ADLARQLGVAEYKVTRTISGTLGFRNFNQMVSQVRIERARAMLARADLAHLPVLTIALDCGFGSIGPFNRAFKLETGLTPTAYRQRWLSNSEP
ncbi:MAG: helix-turn-helix domain-containing protein, partial [Steroidobacteraceae bacterium]